MEVQLRYHLPQTDLTVLKLEVKDDSGDVGGVLLECRIGLVVSDAVLPDHVGICLAWWASSPLGDDGDHEIDDALWEEDCPSYLPSLLAVLLFLT